jgi:hypothetical protein
MDYSPHTRLASWKQWHDRCLLAACDPHESDCLKAFVRMRFYSCWKHYSAGKGDGMEPDAWHLFESYLHIRNAPGGKAWKAWLFYRGRNQYSSDQLACIESGASLIIRDVVRDQLRKEMPRRDTVSYEQVLAPGLDISFLDVLAADNDVISEVCMSEFQRLGRHYAEHEYNHLEIPLKVGLAARFHGMPLNSAVVLDQAGCRKSALSKAVRQYIHGLVEKMKALYPDEPGSAVCTLALMTLKSLGELASSAYVFKQEEEAAV